MDTRKIISLIQSEADKTGIRSDAISHAMLYLIENLASFAKNHALASDFTEFCLENSVDTEFVSMVSAMIIANSDDASSFMKSVHDAVEVAHIEQARKELAALRRYMRKTSEIAA